MTDYQKNRLEVYTRKIEDIQNHSGFFKKNLLKVIIFGILFSLYVPTYTGGHKLRFGRSQSIMDRLGGDYFTAVIWSLCVYASFCIIGHIVFAIQDKYRIKRFQRLIKAIEDDIAKNQDIA
ncbi:hypothetical protein U6A24_03360 [Aquimarina gracilis]|uniref:DUF485 domain-containing protein n=1 Tax=Aquimarina gracilis TaxID=874422 RepID=A0ABU5ZRR5_9FLAO|nr:hypothetical protein [Aquimarina gracilis]MEB3344481.1 hypothetical protein [Aquimarina gracilis]